MRPELSALFDGELEPHEVRPILGRAVADPAMRNDWQAYALIGDQLRHEYRGEPDLTAGVMARIREEPIVLAPRGVLRQSQHHPLFALAASLAGVAVVGWLALADSSTTNGIAGGLAAVSPTPSIVRLADVPQKQQAVAAPAEHASLRGEINEYLLAHHTQAASFRLGDSADNIRTVTVTGRMNRP